MRLAVRSSALALVCCCLGAAFFSNPERLASLTTRPVWEISEIGAVWGDDFDRAALGTNWVIVNNANVSIAGNELLLNQTNVNLQRRVYYLPWLTSSHRWTLRWSQRFGVLDDNSDGAGVGILNFQAEPGANTRGYNLHLHGAGPHLGQVEIERWDGTYHYHVTYCPAMALAAGDVVDCRLSRSGWTISATASNRVNGQVSTASFVFSDFAVPPLVAPPISRVCLYPFRGEVYVDNVSFTIDRRKPARFVVVGDSIAEGYNATNYANGFVNVVQSNFTQAVCNESSSYNSTSNSVSLLPEILALRPGTAILMIGGNDLQFGYPAPQWQEQYSNLVTELQANGVKIKHCLPTPRTQLDLRPLKLWIKQSFPSNDVIDTWTALVTNSYELAPAYRSYDLDGVHPNDAGHLLIGQIIRTNLP